MIYLPGRMRVHDLNETGQQDKRNTENAEPSRPGGTHPGRSLRLLSGVQSTHLISTIGHKCPERKMRGIQIIRYLSPIKIFFALDSYRADSCMLLQNRGHGIVFHLSGPCLWCCPGLGIRFLDRGAALDQKLDQPCAAPAAGPP